MLGPNTHKTAVKDRQGEDPGPASQDEHSESGGLFGDLSKLFSLLAASVRDAARLLGLETRLVIKTAVIMAILGLLLGVVLIGIWFSITLIIAAGLYEYTHLGLTLSILITALLNVASAAMLLLILKRLVKRLTFPETRKAVSTLVQDASRSLQQEEGEPWRP